MDQKLLLGGPLGYAGSAYETFQTVSVSTSVNRGYGEVSSPLDIFVIFRH